MRHITLLFCGFLLILASCQSATTIVNNVSERDANEIVVLLASNGIKAQKVAAPLSTVGGAAAVQMYDIAVPPSQLTSAIAILNQAGFPRLKGTTLLDLFGTAGLVPSDLQDKIRYQEGLSEQLATTIRKMEGIIDANVQITFPQGEEGAQPPLTASVYIKHRGVLDNPNSLLVTKIKRLVSCSLPGLSIDNVCVVADRAVYTDLAPSPCEQMQGNVSIWGVTVAKNSASQFRLIFYIFLILLFIFIALCIWLVWKFHLLIANRGYKTMMRPDPYRPDEFTEKVIEVAPPVVPTEGEMI